MQKTLLMNVLRLSAFALVVALFASANAEFVEDRRRGLREVFANENLPIGRPLERPYETALYADGSDIGQFLGFNRFAEEREIVGFGFGRSMFGTVGEKDVSEGYASMVVVPEGLRIAIARDDRRVRSGEIEFNPLVYDLRAEWKVDSGRFGSQPYMHFIVEDIQGRFLVEHDEGQFIVDRPGFHIFEHGFARTITGERYDDVLTLRFRALDIDTMDGRSSMTIQAMDAVPEPTTMLVLGLGSLLMMRRKKRAA